MYICRGILGVLGDGFWWWLVLSKKMDQRFRINKLNALTQLSNRTFYERYKFLADGREGRSRQQPMTTAKQ